MISLEQIRELEPSLQDAPDEEVARIRELTYSLVQLALECFLEKKTGVKQEVQVPSAYDFLFDSEERKALKRCAEIKANRKRVVEQERTRKNHNA